MSKRLREVLEDFAIENGTQGKMQLAQAVGRHLGTIERWLRGDTNPSQTDAFKLARAVGKSKEEALTLARECSEARKA